MNRLAPRLARITLIAFLFLGTAPSVFAQCQTASTGNAPSGWCRGDCDGNRVVSVSEILRLIRNALDQTAPDHCLAGDPDADGAISVNNLIAAVDALLVGCPSEHAAEVDAVVAAYADDNTPAISVLIGRGDRILYQRTYGKADLEAGEPASTEHQFLLASISKPFTATAVLMLVEQGLIGLDEPVSTYLPELARFGDAVTIRRLLQHTSGLPDYYADPLWSALLERAPLPSNADGLALLAETGTAMFAPGDWLYYLNGGFELLALIVERVSGQRFSDFQQAHIFDPLGMHSTFSIPNPDREASARYAYDYAAQPGGTFAPLPYDPSVYMYGSGDVVSTTGDLFLFDRALFSGQLVGCEVLEQAWTPVRLNSGIEPTLFPVEPDTKYGMGFFVGARNGHRYVGHGGIYLGYRTYYAHFLDEDLVVIVLTAQDFDIFQVFPAQVVFPIADVYLM